MLYGTYNLAIKNKVAIFDTDDCITELVPLDDLYSIRHNILNLTNKNYIGAVDIRELLSNSKSNYVRYNKAKSNLYVGDLRIHIYEYRFKRRGVPFYKFKINDVLIYDERTNFVLAYLFKYKGYIVLRFIRRILKAWLTVVVDNSGDVVSGWRSDNDWHIGDLKLSAEIDMLLKV